mgnify:CR=1 FL=1|tara:strand:+ start:27 stop:674 length:648 start_codon:yes stop_codon:yes gene_type:complete
MAQHDYNIANQTAANARADINNAFSAVATNNAGSSAPSTTFANQWWYDTANNILYIRNEADTAWIKVGDVNQTGGTFSAQIPAGMVQAYAGSAAPTGWLKCNGAAVSRTTYATLFAAIGTTYGSGDGASTFNIPELRGEFVRGWDDSRGIDSGRTLGSFQLDEFKSHTHTFKGSTGSGGSGTSARDAVPETQDTGAAGGDETRPRNVALLYCIKT